MADITRKLRIHGIVQGVFFRNWSREQASRLDLAGWVRNRTDGSVEMLVQGEPANVATMIDLCRDGPAQAQVDRVDVEESSEPAPNPFEKRPTV